MIWQVLQGLRWTVAVLCWTIAAQAAPGAPVDKGRIEYRAPSDCPTQVEFETQVSTRLSNNHLGRSGVPARVLSVEVDLSGTSWRARLELRDQRGEPMTRSVTASSCDAAVEAIALATALLLEPGLPNETEPRETLFSEETAPQKGPPKAPPQTAAAQNREAKQLAPQKHANSMRPEQGASGSLIWGIGPTMAYGATLFGGWSYDASLTRIGLVFAETPFATTDIDGVRLRQRFLAAKLEHCPFELVLGGSTGLLFCASVAAGILVSDGEAMRDTGVLGKGGGAFWLMAGLAPKLRQNWDEFFFEFEPCGFVPATPRRFEVARAGGAGELAFRTPIAVFGTALSIGTEFQ